MAVVGALLLSVSGCSHGDATPRTETYQQHKSRLIQDCGDTILAEGRGDGVARLREPLRNTPGDVTLVFDQQHKDVVWFVLLHHHKPSSGKIGEPNGGGGGGLGLKGVVADSVRVSSVEGDRPWAVLLEPSDPTAC